jgi:serine/threonine protein phosphatase PrpC/tRNA A-37 threonylcarbamoyl transferase component Bud32
MRLRYSRLTTAGPVRPNNEDWLDFWESDDALQREKQGSVAVIADGMGGFERGEVASRMAVDEAIAVFRESNPAQKPADILRTMLLRASAKVFARAHREFRGQPMATTLVASLFRDRAVHIAHVGDSRAYFIREREVQRLTTDHVATALPVKMRLMLERQAMASPQRSQLTRSVGLEPICQPDFATQALQHGDVLLLCTDGLHAFLLDDELREIISKNHPYDACRELVALAQKRGSDDNISLQLIEIRDWEKRLAVSVPGSRPDSAPGPNERPPGVFAAATGTELAPGMLLDDRFEITDLVARSNMASIFKARDRKTNEAVALKVPLMSLESDVAGYERFQREEELGLRLNHPGVLKVIRVEDEKSRPYLAMEFLDGETLAHVLGRRRPLPQAEAVAIAIKVCEALEYLHGQGIVHRDLKPHNIMMCGDGSLRLFDFGIARVDSARRLTFAGFTPAMGTPDYISPEQVKGRRGDVRSDIYSLGAMLYEMVTGATPFEGNSPYIVMNARVTGDPAAPRSLKPDIHRGLEEVILHALEGDPRARFQQVAEMKKELENLDAVAVTDRHLRLRAPQPVRRIGPAVLIGIFIVIGLVVLFFILQLVMKRGR